MIALRFGMQGKDDFERIDASVTCFHFNMQEEDHLEQTNGECHVCALSSTRKPINMQHTHAPQNTIRHTHAKLLVSTVHLNAKCHEATLMMKLLIISVTKHTP